jgi:hypothetical protein
VDTEAFYITFIDMKLPVLNGLETCLPTREINPQAVAIMMTACRQDIAGVGEEIRETKREAGRPLSATTGVNWREAG